METVYYTISDDDGDTWSDRIALTENSGKVGETDLAVTSQGDIWVVYNSCQEFCGIHYRTNADNGDSWSPETLLEADVYSPSIASSGQELMIAFSRQDCSPITCDSDIWYKVATPEDIPQSPSVQYTTYQGRDYLPSVATLADGNFAIAWSSDRRFADGLWTTPYTIWFGIPGVREDISPPPVISRFNHAPLPNPDADDEVFITANIDDDEPGVSATVLWNKDGVQQADVPMADNGSSGDAQSGDGVSVWDLGGIPGDVIGDGLSFRIQGGDGANNQKSHHVITPLSPAAQVFSYVDLSQVSQAFPPQQGPAFLPLFPEGLLRDDAGLYPAFPQNQHAASPEILLEPTPTLRGCC